MSDETMMRAVLRRYLEPIPKLFAVHVNVGGASFLKHYDYYHAQGGTTQAWGRNWTIVLAMNEQAARLFAIKHLGARTDALFCPQCGNESHGQCEAVSPPEGVRIPNALAAEEYERALGFSPEVLALPRS